ncbi:unnamed protein product [Gordionus sp. m RMFG-2023]
MFSLLGSCQLDLHHNSLLKRIPLLGDIPKTNYVEFDISAAKTVPVITSSNSIKRRRYSGCSDKIFFHHHSLNLVVANNINKNPIALDLARKISLKYRRLQRLNNKPRSRNALVDPFLAFDNSTNESNNHKKADSGNVHPIRSKREDQNLPIPFYPGYTVPNGSNHSSKPFQLSASDHTWKKIPSLEHPQPNLKKWLSIFQNWDNAERSLALKEVIKLCHPSQIRHMMNIIEPLFQRDFISLLPKELALYVLSYLSADDLLRSAATCRKWRVLAHDNLLWREKCRELNISSNVNLPISSNFSNSSYRSVTMNGYKEKCVGTDVSEMVDTHWKNVYIRDKKIEVNWRKRPITRVKVLKGHDDHVITCLQFDGRYVVSGSDDNTLRVWSVSYPRGPTPTSFPSLSDNNPSAPSPHLGFTPSIHPANLNLTPSAPHPLYKEGRCLATLTGHTGGVWSSEMAVSVGPDRQRIITVVSGSTDRTIKIWRIIDHEDDIDYDAGKELVDDEEMILENLSYPLPQPETLPSSEHLTKGQGSKCIHTLTGHTSTVRCMSLKGDRVVSGSRDATLRLWDIRSGVCAGVMLGHVAAVRCVAFDGRRVVSGAYDYTVKVWDAVTRDCLHTLHGHTNRVYSLQFDGSHIVSGSLDTSIRVWDVETGTCLHTLVGHQSLTSRMELKDNLLVSGNADSTVKIWDIKSGQCLHTLHGPHKHQSAVTSLQFDRGKTVLTSSDDGTVKLWDARTGEYIRDLVKLDSGGSGGVVWRIKAGPTKLVCAVGSRNGTEETKLLVLDFGLQF